MAEQGYEHEGGQDRISKLPFSAVAVPDPACPSDSIAPHEMRDFDQYIARGPPATKLEVFSYYAYYAGNNGIGSFQ
jgi:hypothetical protein